MALLVCICPQESMTRHLLHHDPSAFTLRVSLTSVSHSEGLKLPHNKKFNLFCFKVCWVQTLVFGQLRKSICRVFEFFMNFKCLHSIVVSPMFFFFSAPNLNRSVSGPRNPGRSVWMDIICPSWRKIWVASSPCACGYPDVPKWKPTFQVSTMNARSLTMLTQRSTCAPSSVSEGLMLWWKSLKLCH